MTRPIKYGLTIHATETYLIDRLRANWYDGAVQKCVDILTRLGVTHKCDRRTDGQREALLALSRSIDPRYKPFICEAAATITKHSSTVSDYVLQSFPGSLLQISPQLYFTAGT